MEEYLRLMSDSSLLKAISRWQAGLRWYEDHEMKWHHRWRFARESLHHSLALAFAECRNRHLVW